MQEQAHSGQRGGNLPLSVWLLIVLAVIAVVTAFAAGAAYTGISQARTVAARASLGQIESTYNLAGRAAADEGLKPEGDGEETLIQSYGSGGEQSAYEAYVLSAMLDAFGPDRDFDFAVSRYEDLAGTHTRILFFPVLGRTDMGSDPFYVSMDGQLVDGVE